MIWWFWVFLSGSVGVLSRASLERLMGPENSRISTLLANWLGCWIAGVLLQAPLPVLLRSALLLGFCGGLTTLSTLIIQLFESLNKSESPRWGEFLVLFTLHFLGGLFCLWLGNKTSVWVVENFSKPT